MLRELGFGAKLPDILWELRDTHMLRSVRVSAAKMKGLYTLWVSWNTLTGKTRVCSALGGASRTLRDWARSPTTC